MTESATCRSSAYSDAWAADWGAGVEYHPADAEATPPVAASEVTHNNREWIFTGATPETSTSENAPGLGSSWTLKEATKAYSFVSIGALSTASPQFSRDDKVPYFIDPADGKIKLYATFIQGGENIGTDAEPVWVVRSTGWIKKTASETLTSYGRMGAFFR